MWTVFGANTLTGGGGNNTIVNSGTFNINFQPGANPNLNTTLSGTATKFTFNGLSATDALTNNSVINSAGTVSFLNLANVNNNTPGVFNVGSKSGATEITNFSTTTAVGALFVPGALFQTVTNTGTYNVFAVQPTSVSGPYNGALNFYGGANSTFNNSGGVINMQADGGTPKNAVTLNTNSMAGTSDVNYTYTWSNAPYNFVGSGSGGGTTTFGAVKSRHQSQRSRLDFGPSGDRRQYQRHNATVREQHQYRSGFDQPDRHHGCGGAGHRLQQRRGRGQRRSGTAGYVVRELRTARRGRDRRRRLHLSAALCARRSHLDQRPERQCL